MFPKVAAVLSTLLFLIASCSGDAPEPEEPANSVTEVVVQQGDRLRTIDIEVGDVRDIGTLSSDDVAVSPDGTTVAYSEKGRHNGTLFLAGLEELDDARKTGPGMSPVFSLDGSEVAVVTVDPNYNICPTGTADPTGKGCVFGESIDVYPVNETDGDPMTALGANVWKFIGWTIDDQILAGTLKNGYLSLGFAGAAFEEVQQFHGFHPDSVFAVSPMELTILYQNEDDIATQTLGATQAVTTPLALPTGTKLLEAAWSPNGERIAVLAQHGNVTEAFIVTAADGSVDALGEAIEDGGLTWSADGASVAFVGGTKKSQEVVSCEPEADCIRVPSDGPTRVLGLR